MTRKLNTKTQTSAAAVLSAGVLLASGAAAAAQAPKAPAPGQRSPAAPQGLPQTAPVGMQEKVDRGSAHIKFATTFYKWRESLTVAGMMNGSPVFKTPQGEFFQVEPNTGDLKFHTAESLGFLKIHEAKTQTPAAAAGRAATFLKFEGIKGEGRVSVLGVDAMGHVLQQNSRGEKFYLSPSGDMVFVK